MFDERPLCRFEMQIFEYFQRADFTMIMVCLEEHTAHIAFLNACMRIVLAVEIINRHLAKEDDGSE